MITEEEVNIFEKYKGVWESYHFEKKDSSPDIFDAMDWVGIWELIGKIILLKSGNASAEFEETLKQEIRDKTENSAVVAHLERLAEKKKAEKW